MLLLFPEAALRLRLVLLGCSSSSKFCATLVRSACFGNREICYQLSRVSNVRLLFYELQLNISDKVSLTSM